MQPPHFLDRRQEFFERGFLIARAFFSPAEMAALRAELQSAQPRRGGADWLTAGNMIFRSNLYFRSPFLQAFVSQPRIVDFLAPIVGPSFWVRWDQAVNKQPGGVEFPWHQDNAYNRLRVPHFQFWVAATAIRRENGGLWLDPGSHRRGRLPHRFVDHHAVYQGTPQAPLLIEADAGDVILFSSLMLHYTSPNASSAERWAYVVEYVPVDDFDPFIPAPYFMVASDGRPNPRFVHLLRGRLRLRNQLMYLLPRLGVAGLRAGAAVRRLTRRMVD